MKTHLQFLLVKLLAPRILLIMNVQKDTHLKESVHELVKLILHGVEMSLNVLVTKRVSYGHYYLLCEYFILLLCIYYSATKIFMNQWREQCLLACYIFCYMVSISSWYAITSALLHWQSYRCYWSLYHTLHFDRPTGAIGVHITWHGLLRGGIS